MSDLVAAAEYNRRSVTPGSVQGNDGSFVTPSSGVTGGRNSVSPHPQAVTPPPNPSRPSLKISIPNRSSAAGYCSCGMPLSTASACMYCSCEISKEIIACGSAGKLTVKMKQILAEAQK